MHYLKSFSLVLILLTSCSLEKQLEYKYRKAERKIEKLTLKYPQLLQKDTIRDTIKLTISRIYTDSVFKYLPNDTIILEKDRLRIQYITRNDSVFLSGECKADTLYYPIEIPVEKIVVRKSSISESLLSWLKTSWWLLLLIVFVSLLLKYLWKFIKPF